MSASPKPLPPWRVRLEGSDVDLKDLASCLQQGQIRIVEQGGSYFLESSVLDELQEPSDVSSKARDLVKAISSVARVRRSIAKPIGFAGMGWRDSNGTWRQMVTASLVSILLE
jgi:hypothetical protein